MYLYTICIYVHLYNAQDCVCSYFIMLIYGANVILTDKGHSEDEKKNLSILSISQAVK